MGNSTVTLSPKQQRIVDATGNVVINACPGSGKTFSVAARISHLLKNRSFHHQGIAAISFTNTAWQEIEKKLRDDFIVDVPIRFPHFLGTIDSFINTYIFLPYGHLIMGCDQRPQLIGGLGYNHLSWKNPRKYYNDICIYIDPDELFDKVSFDINNNPISIANPQDFNFSWNKIHNKDGSLNKKVQVIIDNKWLRFSESKACQADANYFAFRILNEFPLIARNISLRFPYLIIDEAQDTTDVQMAIVDILQQHTKEIMLIGDPDQAIFEWNNAKPELFHEKIKQWAPTIELDENRRSSKKICDCANAFIGVEKSTPFEEGEIKDYDFEPEVREYKRESQEYIDEIKSDFLELCKERGIEENKIAIIYRSNSLGNFLGKQSIKKENQPWIVGNYHVRDLVQGKYLYENGNLKKGFKYLEHGFHKAMSGNPYLESDFIKRQIAEKGFVKYRQEIFDFIDLLPICNGEQLDQWRKKAVKSISGKYSFDFPINSALGKKTIDSFFKTEDLPKDEFQCHVGTIHSVKGETYDAVLMILKDAAGNNRKYRNLLEGCQNDEDREEKRIIYVGLTRARMILVLAVPVGCKDIWNEKLKLKSTE